jgi:hypothetical protein
MVWGDRSNALFFAQGTIVTMGYIKGLSDFKTIDFFSLFYDDAEWAKANSVPFYLIHMK